MAFCPQRNGHGSAWATAFTHVLSPRCYLVSQSSVNHSKISMTQRYLSLSIAIPEVQLGLTQRYARIEFDVMWYRILYMSKISISLFSLSIYLNLFICPTPVSCTCLVWVREGGGKNVKSNPGLAAKRHPELPSSWLLEPGKGSEGRIRHYNLKRHGEKQKEFSIFRNSSNFGLW